MYERFPIVFSAVGIGTLVAIVIGLLLLLLQFERMGTLRGPARVLVLVGVGAIALSFLVFGIGAIVSRVTIESGVLHVGVPFYGHDIPTTTIDTNNSRIVDLNDDSPFALAMRTNGLGVPGCNIGWFTMNNGRTALVAIGSNKGVLHVATREGFDLLLSVETPDRLLAALQRAQQ